MISYNWWSESDWQSLTVGQVITMYSILVAWLRATIWEFLSSKLPGVAWKLGYSIADMFVGHLISLARENLDDLRRLKCTNKAVLSAALIAFRKPKMVLEIRCKLLTTWGTKKNKSMRSNGDSQSLGLLWKLCNVVCCGWQSGFKQNELDGELWDSSWVSVTKRWQSISAAAISKFEQRSYLDEWNKPIALVAMHLLPCGST